MKTTKNQPSFIEILENPESRRLVEAIEEIGATEEETLLEIKKGLIKKLKTKFNYTYRA